MLQGFQNLFKTAPVTPAVTATPAAQPGATPVTPAQPAPSGDATLATATPAPENVPVTTPGTAPNGVVPATPEADKSPLDEYATLWENDPNAAQEQSFTPEQLDPAKLQEVIANTNMTAVITPEIQARINAGGEDANTALNEAMNLVAQHSLMQSTTVANKMMNAQITKAMEAMMSKIPNLVKEQNVSNSLHEANPVFSNPAVAPVISAVKSQLQTKFPKATANELTTMAQDFVKTMSESLNPAAPVKSPLDKEIDWSNFENEF